MKGLIRMILLIVALISVLGCDPHGGRVPAVDNIASGADGNFKA